MYAKPGHDIRKLIVGGRITRFTHPDVRLPGFSTLGGRQTTKQNLQSHYDVMFITAFPSILCAHIKNPDIWSP